MKLVELKRRLTAGTVWNVTNHYIKLPDHPCFGTRRRTIVKSTTGGFRLSQDGRPEGDRIRWPKATQIKEENGALLIFGHPTPDALFLTLKPIAS